jgi:predicted RNA polymerase sigma factor
MLAARRSSPVIELNKNIALSKLTDAATGLAVLEKLRTEFDVENYPLYFIALGELQVEAGRGTDAVSSFERAEKLTTNKSVLRFLAKKKEAAKASVTKV